jgi:hypothetical protein
VFRAPRDFCWMCIDFFLYVALSARSLMLLDVDCEATSSHLGGAQFRTG